MSTEKQYDENLPDNQEQRRHELLCAYVLDEVTDEERAEVEGLLENSAEYRTELERIRATVSLVREAFPAGESLSPDKTAALAAAAGAPTHGEATPPPAAGGPRPLADVQHGWTGPALRMAATVAFLTLGYAGFRAVMQPEDRGAYDDSVASYEAQFKSAGSEGAAEDELRELHRAEAGRNKESSMEEGEEADLEGLELADAVAKVEGDDADRRLTDGPVMFDFEKAGGQASGNEAWNLDKQSGETMLGAVTVDPEALRQTTLGGLYREEDQVETLKNEITKEIQVRADQVLYSAQDALTVEGKALAAGEKTVLSVQPNADPAAPQDRYAYSLGQEAQGAGSPNAPLDSGDTKVAEDVGLHFRALTEAPSASTATATTGEAAGLPGAAREARRAAGPTSPGPAGAAPPASPAPMRTPRLSAGGGGAPAPEAETRTAGGRYRGAGDTVPPAEPVPDNSVASSDDFYLGLGLGGGAGGTIDTRRKAQNHAEDEKLAAQAGVDVQVIAGLRGLGYLGEARAYVTDFDVEASNDPQLGLVESLGRRNQLQHQDPCGRYSWQGRRLTPEQREALIRLECMRLLNCCRPRPQESPRDMYFRFWGDNPFEIAALDRQSTFSVDVDTASYTLARRYLREGHVPSKEQIRTEEFLNYFKPDLAAPTNGDTFAVHTEIAPSRFSADNTARWMLRVGVRGKEVSNEERRDVRLTFVIDTSGSMKENNRMGLVKQALRLLLNELSANDMIAIVAFSREARLVLPMTSAAQRGVVEAAIYGLNPDGGTNAEAGLLMGYEVAAQNRGAAANNRVVLLSDGVANIGNTDQDRIAQQVKGHRENDIYLNTIGVGMNNHNDVFLEQLANKGDGLCNYVDSELEARRALVENFTGAFETIARNVKIQVEFDPRVVYRYRLLGYENRAIADQDFRNDAVDAGEVNAGHQVCALYELELATVQPEAALGKVMVRWLNPDGGPQERGAAHEIDRAFALDTGTGWEGASAGYRRAVVVAQFAEMLRRSRHARGESIDELLSECSKLAPQLNDVEFTEFHALVQRSRDLILSTLPHYDELTRTLDAVRHNHYLRGEYERIGQADPQVIKELEAKNQELEDLIKAMVKQQIEKETESVPK